MCLLIVSIESSNLVHLSELISGPPLHFHFKVCSALNKAILGLTTGNFAIELGHPANEEADFLFEFSIVLLGNETISLALCSWQDMIR
eukprot:m.141620 g.141620  ORF g.141620 m.141620 type:complete len:88 (+) comp16132_c0_seq1:1446-1709(+)